MLSKILLANELSLICASIYKASQTCNEGNLPYGEMLLEVVR